MHLCLFEDSLATNFLPLAHFRPVYDLRCGILTLRDKAIHYISPESASLHVRQYLAPLLSQENPGIQVNAISGRSCLLLNGRCIMTAKVAKALRNARPDTLFVSGQEIAGALLTGDALADLRNSLPTDAIDLTRLGSVASVEVGASFVRYPWDLVHANEREIENDFVQLTRKAKQQPLRKGKIHKSAVLINKKRVAIGRDSLVSAGAVLDASAGPIYVGSGVKVFPTAVIEGPCYIGDGTLIKIGAKIYGNTSIGPMCKVGGEVEHSIIHSHTNKQHDGFLGHSYLSMWVNLGAGTTTSNLKNTYGSIKVYVNGSMVDSGKMFVGLTAGDHVKTGINSTLDTGTVVGPSSNIYGTMLPPKFVPSFSWGDARHFETYDVEKALAVAVKVMGRRNVTASAEYQRLFRQIFTMTAHERTTHST